MKVPENHGSGMQFGGPKGDVRWGPIPPVLLRDRVRDRNGVKYYSIRTEQAYCDWIRRFIIFHGKRHPSGGIEAYLTRVDRMSD